MTIRSAASVKTLFQTGDRPSQQDFTDFIDSTMRVSMIAVATAVEGGSTGVPRFTGTSNVTLDPAGAFGRQMLSTATTAQGANALNITVGGVVGSQIYGTNSTTAAVNLLGPGSAGLGVFQSQTTANAQNSIGAGTVGQALIEAVTTASASNLFNLSGTTGYFLNATAKYFSARDATALGTSYIKTPILASITPTSSASRFLVTVGIQWSATYTKPTNRLQFSIFSNASDLSLSNGVSALAVPGGTVPAGSSVMSSFWSYQIIDNPATSGTVTYSFRVNSPTNSVNPFAVNGDDNGAKNGLSFITVEELAS